MSHSHTVNKVVLDPMAETQFGAKFIGEEEAEALRKKGTHIPKIVWEDKREGADLKSLNSESRLRVCKRLWTIRRMALSEFPHLATDEVRDILLNDYGKSHGFAADVDVFLSNALKRGEARFEDGVTVDKDGDMAQALDIFSDPMVTEELFRTFCSTMGTDAMEAAGILPRGTLNRRKMQVYAENTRAATAHELRSGKADGPAGPLGRAARRKVASVWEQVAKDAGATEEQFAAVGRPAA